MIHPRLVYTRINGKIGDPKKNQWHPQKKKMTPKCLLKNKSTLPEINIAPENRPSQKETSIPTIYIFSGAFAVGFREGNKQSTEKTQTPLGCPWYLVNGL